MYDGGYPAMAITTHNHHALYLPTYLPTSRRSISCSLSLKCFFSADTSCSNVFLNSSNRFSSIS